MDSFPLYGNFTGSLRGFYVDSSLLRLFLFTESLRGLYGALRGLFSIETFPLYRKFTGTLQTLTFRLFGKFTGS